MSVHVVNGVTIDGGAIDVLYKLYHYGPQESGDLPSKDGAERLRELGWLKTDWETDAPHSLTTEGLHVAAKYYDDADMSNVTIEEFEAQCTELGLRDKSKRK